MQLIWRGSLAVVVALSLTACAARRKASQTPAPVSLGATVEASDPHLSAALLAEAIAPTAENYLIVAREYVRLGILDAAHSRITRAISVEPGSAAAHESLARVWRDWSIPSRALGPAYRAVALAPESASARNTLGTIFDALGQDIEARVAYTAAFDLDSKASWALNNLCYLELRLGRLDEARRHCEAALEVTPSLSTARNNLGLSHAAAGDLARASVAFSASGDRAAAHYNLGMVLLVAGRYQEAAVDFEQAIRLREGFTAAKRWAHYARMRSLSFKKDDDE